MIQHPEADAAFEVPKWKRVRKYPLCPFLLTDQDNILMHGTVQVGVTVLYCLFAAGVVFGYAAIKPVLKKEGAYRDICSDPGPGGVSEDTCVEIHLNLMFTVAAVATNVAALPIGAILDHYGPRVCGLMGAFFLALGSLTLSFENKVPFDGLLFGYLFLALGGPFTYISAFQLSNAFPRNSGLVLALLTGAFDASSALFLVYRIIFERSGGSFGHRKFFLYYLVVPAVIVIFQFAILPAHSYKTIGEMIEEVEEPLPGTPMADQVDESTALLHEEQRQAREDLAANLEEVLEGNPKADRQAKREERKNEISGVWGVMHQNTVWQQLRSPWFIFICLFTVVQMTRINYFVATIRPQYEAIFGNPKDAEEINNFFDLALPLGGIISIPFIGLVLDHTSTVTVLATLVTVATSIGVLGIIPERWSAYLGVVLFVLYRPFYYTAVSDYSAKVFGFRTFGTVYGTIICLSGLFNFSQSGLDYLFHETFHGNPMPVNLILLSAGLAIGIALVLYVAIKARNIKRKMLGHEAARAPEMPINI